MTSKTPRKRKGNGKMHNEIGPIHIFKRSKLSNITVGYLVWGKVCGSRIWPGVIIGHNDCGMQPPKKQCELIFWFGDDRVSVCSRSKIYSFTENFNEYYCPSSPAVTYRKGIYAILKECYRRAEAPRALPDNFECLLQWARNGFEGLRGSENIKAVIPDKVRERLNAIKSKQDLSDKNNEFLMSSSDSDSDEEERRVWRPKARLLKDVIAGTALIESVCIACEKGLETPVITKHPLFEGGLCKPCKDISNSTMEMPIDEKTYFCAVCCSPGDVLVCDNIHCDKIYCTFCIQLFVGSSALESIKDTDPWFCFLCSPFDPSTHGLFRARPECISEKVEERPSNGDSDDEFPEIFVLGENLEKRPLRVMSLFDGIATGLYVLDKLNLEVEAYFSSEIDGNAMNVSKLHFNPRITYIGDVEKWTDVQVKEICPIDLLIGGSPCNDLSSVNPLRKGLWDPVGTGALFFHFFRIQKLIQRFNGDRHLFWLFENVASMSKGCKRAITLFLQRRPVAIDAKYFSPQRRIRYYWGNIPDLGRHLAENFGPSQSSLSDSVLSACNRRATVDKVNCITTNPNSLRVNGGLDCPIVMNGTPDVPWITEIEKIFGFDAHYTDVGNLGIRERQILLGRSWSVPVIAHILKPLQQWFTSSIKDGQPAMTCESVGGDTEKYS